MSVSTAVSPEDVLIAVLHKVGSETRLVNDVRLASLFQEAAEQNPDLFGEFTWHPQYHDSKTLRNALQVLDLGGAIVRENATIRNFRTAPRVIGEYGEGKFRSLGPSYQKSIEILAQRIRETFNKPSQAGVD